MTATHWTHYHWPAGRYYLAGDCDSLDTLSLAHWEILPGWWLRLTGHTITGPLGDITWLAGHWPAGRYYLAGDCDSPDTTGPLGDITWLVTVTHWHTITGPLGDITWLVTATHCTHYHWPAGRYYLAGDCDSLDTLSLARWETLPGWWLWLTGHVLSLARWEILPGWWLWLTGHTITGPLGDITWLVTATHWTHYHWPAGRYYLAGDCDSLDTLSLARWEILPGWWLWLTGWWLLGDTHLAGDCYSLDTLSLARW